MTATSLGLFDPANLIASVPVHRHACSTELDAARRVAPVVVKLRCRTLEWIRSAGADGLTAAEGGARYAVERGLHPTDASSRTSIGPRCSELERSGFIRKSGRRRGGCGVYVATDKQGDGSECGRESQNAAARPCYVGPSEGSNHA